MCAALAHAWRAPATMSAWGGLSSGPTRDYRSAAAPGAGDLWLPSTSARGSYSSARPSYQFRSGGAAPRMSEPEPEVDPRRPDPDRTPTAPPVRMPIVDDQLGNQMDVISRLLKDRILLLGTQVNDEVANVLVAQLLYLANEDSEKDITL